MMYVDLTVLFLIYAISVISLGVSLYALVTLKEIEQYYKKKYSSKPKSAWDHYHTKAAEKPKSTAKGHWG